MLPDYIATREVAKEELGQQMQMWPQREAWVVRIHFEFFKEKVEASGQQAVRSRIDNMSVS